MSRYLAQMTVSTAEVERAAIGGLALVVDVEKLTRRKVEVYGEPARVWWVARGRGVNGVREAPWVPDSRPPWWARGLTCFAEVER